MSDECTVSVTATRPGEYKGYRNTGAIFYVPEAMADKSSWWVRTASAEVAPVAPKATEPITFSELNKEMQSPKNRKGQNWKS